VQAELASISAIVPSWHPEHTDSLREAAIHHEREWAQTILHWLALLLATRQQTDRRLVRHAITFAVLEPLQGHELRDAQAFLNRLSWPH
jgi:hypothetical protein